MYVDLESVIMLLIMKTDISEVCIKIRITVHDSKPKFYKPVPG